MRVLHFRHVDELRLAAGTESQTECGRREDGRQREHLPLRNLSKSIGRGARRFPEQGGLAMPVQETTQKQQSKDVKGGTKGEPKPVQQSREKEQAHKAAPAPAQRDMKLRAGVASAVVSEDGLAEVTRVVPAGEPPQLATNDQLKYIGKRITRVDGAMKTTGRARYTADIYLPGML